MKGGHPSRSKKSDFARRLRALRLAAGLNQTELARRLGISQPSYARWERYNVAIRPERLSALAKALKVPVESLIAGDARPRTLKGKVRIFFEALSRLPRRKQEKVFRAMQKIIGEQGERTAGQAKRRADQ